MAITFTAEGTPTATISMQGGVAVITDGVLVSVAMEDGFGNFRATLFSRAGDSWVEDAQMTAFYGVGFECRACRVNDSVVAINYAGTLRTYSVTGGAFSGQLGGDFSLPSSWGAEPYIVNLDTNRIVAYDGSVDMLRVYDYDTENHTWSLYASGALGNWANWMARMSETRVVVAENTTGDDFVFRVYDLVGTAWVQVGNDSAPFTWVGWYSTLVGFSDRFFAFGTEDGDAWHVYEFDGQDSTLTHTSTGEVTMGDAFTVASSNAIDSMTTLTQDSGGNSWVQLYSVAGLLPPEAFWTRRLYTEEII